jgi:acylpyruvate hydrolase
MRLLTYRTGTGTRAARVDGNEVHDLPFADVGAVLAAAADAPGGLAEVTDRTGAARRRAAVELAPVITGPSKIFCVGHNYAAHIAETGRDTPAHPTLFAKFACALVGAADPVELPAESQAVDWEAELAVVIGRPVRRASEAEARAAIAGYTIINDVSMRDWQLRTPQWLAGKTFERSSPFGPELVTLDELPDPDDLAIRCTVDGVVMQESRTSDLLFDPVSLIQFISTICTLVPGDVIATGTPSGIGNARDPKVFLQPGQTMVTEVEGIGRLVNVCREEGR